MFRLLFYLLAGWPYYYLYNEETSILAHADGSKVFDAKFLAHFASECVAGILTIINMSAHCRVPLAWLDVLPVGPTLQIHLAPGVKHMQVNHRMEQFAATMTLATGGRTHHCALFIH